MTKLLADVFKHNTTLLHLDLRHNHIGAALVPRLASAFAANHTIRGLHCDGNAMRIDARGFMQVCSNGHLEDADGAGGGLLGGRVVQRDMRQDTGQQERQLVWKVPASATMASVPSMAGHGCHWR